MNFFWFSTIALINSIWLNRNVGYPTWKWIAKVLHTVMNEKLYVQNEILLCVHSFQNEFQCIYAASVDGQVYALWEIFSWKAFLSMTSKWAIDFSNIYYNGAIFCIFIHLYFNRWLHLYLVDDFSFQFSKYSNLL